MTGNPARAGWVRFPQHFHLLSGEPESHSALTAEEKAAWSDRTCGLASLRTILAYHRLPVPSQTELLSTAIESDYFTDRGILHTGLSELATSHGLSGHAVKVADVRELFDLADRGYPSIVSVAHKLPSDGRRGGHLVVATGTVPGSDDVWFVDPSRWGRRNSQVPVDRFAASFSGRAILYWPTAGPRPTLPTQPDGSRAARC
ncbi:MAG: cysteine peptidase family C39 domain-containing protein [Actinomycetota bacterium]